MAERLQIISLNIIFLLFDAFAIKFDLKTNCILQKRGVFAQKLHIFLELRSNQNRIFPTLVLIPFRYYESVDSFLPLDSNTQCSAALKASRWKSQARLNLSGNRTASLVTLNHHLDI